MARRPSLTMGAVAPTARSSQEPSALPAPPAVPVTIKPPSRAGKVQLGGYLSPEAKRQIDVFAAIHGRTIQSIFEEMIDDFSRKHGLHRLVGNDQS